MHHGMVTDEVIGLILALNAGRMILHQIKYGLPQMI
jgi:hypothetical protein